MPRAVKRVATISAGCMSVVLSHVRRDCPPHERPRLSSLARFTTVQLSNT